MAEVTCRHFAAPDRIQARKSMAAKAIRCDAHGNFITDGHTLTQSTGRSSCHGERQPDVVYSCKRITEPESDQTSLDPNKQRMGNTGMQGPKRSTFSTVSQRCLQPDPQRGGQQCR